MLTQQIVRELLNYDHDTGLLTWRERGLEWFPDDGRRKWWNKRFAGAVAGSLSRSTGYHQIGILDHVYLSHRVIWLHVEGRWPENQIDHINHNRTDNSWLNLRHVTPEENQKNRSRRSNKNASGNVGVVWAAGKWRAEIKSNGRKYYYGYFANIDDAIAARKAAERRHGFHENHGRAA